MTYFQDAGRDYVMWSDRRITMQGGEQVIEPADIRIAVIDPEKPWQIISPITRVIRPDFGWDRMETEVDEAPYMIRNGDDLLVTFSGSSTGMADLYDVGLLRAKRGENLLDPDAWEVIGYPLLTKESVPNEFGPGHNNFVVDRESGDIVMSYHAVPHDAQGRTLHRQPGLRRLHWAKTGLPYLEMTPERDLAPELEQVTLSVTVE
jgi:GH43 family beta-xylosidase